MIPDPCLGPGHGSDIPPVKLLQQLTTQQYDIHMFPLSGLWHQAYIYSSHYLILLQKVHQIFVTNCYNMGNFS